VPELTCCWGAACCWANRFEASFCGSDGRHGPHGASLHGGRPAAVSSAPASGSGPLRPELSVLGTGKPVVCTFVAAVLSA